MRTLLTSVRDWLALLVLLVLPTSLIPAWGATYTLAVVPQYTAVDIGLRWAPVLERLAKETGITLQIRSAASIPEFETEFLSGIPDFVYLNPYHMVMASKAQSYRPLLRSVQPLSGILVVKKGGNIKQLADLEGSTIAFPAPNAFGASLYMRALLSEREKINFTPTYVGTHQNVYRHILHNEAQAGGGIESTLEKEPAGVQTAMTVLHRTPNTASHPLAVHPRVPKQAVDQVLQALRHLASTPEGKKMLQTIELDDAIPADYSRDYAPLESLRLDRYAVSKKK